MVQRRQDALKPLPDSTQEEKENKGMGLINAVNQRDTDSEQEVPLCSYLHHKIPLK